MFDDLIGHSTGNYILCNLHGLFSDTVSENRVWCRSQYSVFFVSFLPLMQKPTPASSLPDNEYAFTEIDPDTSPAFPYLILGNRPVFPA
jgi:hypothetical protein